MSFNAKFGTSVHILTIVCLSIGLALDIPSAILISGYLSLINGIALLLNTFVIEKGAYIGTVLRPVMILSMILLVVIGASIISSPLLLLAQGIISNYLLVVLILHLIILFFVAMHLITGS